MNIGAQLTFSVFSCSAAQNRTLDRIKAKESWYSDRDVIMGIPPLRFEEYLQSSNLILLDGAMDTELDQRGIIGRCESNLTNPDAVVAVHKDYVSEGDCRQRGFSEVRIWRCGTTVCSYSQVSECRTGVGVAVCVSGAEYLYRSEDGSQEETSYS